MARIRTIERGARDVRVHPTETDAIYQAVVADKGTKYFHFSTFGSDTRKEAGTSSQTIQMDEATARKFIRALREVFPNL